MKKSLVVMGTVLLILGITMGSLNFLAPFSGGGWVKVETTQEEFSSHKLSSIRISNDIGKIIIDGHDGDMVKVRVEKHAPESRLDRIKVKMEEKGSSLFISTSFPAGASRMGVDFYIRVPNGNLGIYAYCNLGWISLSDIEISEAELKTALGSITVRDVRADDIRGFSDLGSIKVFLQELPDMLKLETDLGSVEVRIPKDSSVKIVAKTDLGKVRCDLDLENVEQKRSYINGSLGDGENRIDIRTDLGSIRIGAV